MSLANQFVINPKKYIHINKFLGHSVFVACHQEDLYKQIPFPRIMPIYILPLTCYTYELVVYYI